jgi:FlaG/FlaF family flagellin (archaellin)
MVFQLRNPRASIWGVWSRNRPVTLSNARSVTHSTASPRRQSRGERDTKQRSGRAVRGLVLVFVLSFVNLLGVVVTAAAVGGVAPWSRWQFIGMFGVVEAASGLANVISPNIWRLPIAELRTSARTDVKLAASALLLPHWGGLARCVAGLVFVALAGWQEGVGFASAALVPFVLALACTILAISAILARAGVAWPELDVVQFVVRWGRREKELTPISISASVLQFLLTITTIPAAKLLPPSILYQPEIAPSATALLLSVAVSVVLLALVYLLWSGRVDVKAPVEQQREAEEGS